MTFQASHFLRFYQLTPRYLFAVFIILLLIAINSCNDSPVSSTKNKPPVWAVNDTMRVVLTLDSLFSLKLSAICSDEKNGPISYEITSLFPSGDTIINAVYTMAALHCPADSFTVSIVATDSDGLSSTLNIKFTIIKIQAKKLSQDTLRSWLLTGPPDEFVLIDTRGRSDQDFTLYPYLIGNLNCKPYNLRWDDAFLQYYKMFSKSQHIVIYCGSETRAGLASNYLASIGYLNVYNAGGIGTWSDQTLKLPIADTVPVSNIPKPSMRKAN